MSTAKAQVFEPDPVDSNAADAGCELETVDCLSCGASDSDTVVIAPDPVTGLGGNFRVVRCRDCGLTYTNPRPTLASIGQFYPHDYAPHIAAEQHDGWLVRRRNAVIAAWLRCRFGFPPQPTSLLTRLSGSLAGLLSNRRKRRLLSLPYRAPGRLLDFGCGAGHFLEQMRDFGWQVEGLDISDPCAADVTKRTGIHVHVGSLPHTAIADNSFDAITMWNALEHVHQPREIIRAARKALRPGGVLVVGVPNIGSWGFSKFQQDWYCLKLPRHLLHFTPDSLRDIMQRENMNILSLEQIGRAGWLRKSVRLATRDRVASIQQRLCGGKRISKLISRWSELTGQANFIKIVVEKPTTADETVSLNQ